ncbi:MAG: hypothetical protein LC647_18450, partial [Beggiatoa sp.]|nr:hypothetical protein [Beggiatoa sp.]
AMRWVSMHDGYTKDRTALLFVDPYNDFLSVGGKLWPYVREVVEEVGLLDNLHAITAAIRKAGIPVFIVPSGAKAAVTAGMGKYGA